MNTCSVVHGCSALFMTGFFYNNCYRQAQAEPEVDWHDNSWTYCTITWMQVLHFRTRVGAHCIECLHLVQFLLFQNQAYQCNVQDAWAERQDQSMPGIPVLTRTDSTSLFELLARCAI